MQIKTTVKYHFSLIRTTNIKKKKEQKITSMGEDVKKLEPLCIAGRIVNWCNHNGKQFPKKLKSEVPLDLAILLYLKKLKAGS